MKLNVRKPKNDSPYARVGADLVDMGYHAIPVLPGSKRPGSMSGGQWYGDMDWSRFCDRTPTEIETSIWSRWPDAGVCIAIDRCLKVIDVDTDDMEIRAAIEAVIPAALVKKKGQKGYSAFYRGSEAIVSRPFSLILPGGFESRIVDLLAHGRQTVLPPTLHPDTGRPYEWTTEDTLLDTDIEKLPLLDDDIAERIEEALRPFGEVQEFKPIGRTGEEVFGETIWREVNNFALANLDSWVPALFAPDDIRRTRGGYRARACWRGVENHNVGIHPEGITDWGGSKSHTPIDLVMSVMGSGNLYEPAYKWLVEKTGYKPDDQEWVKRGIESARRIAEKSREKRDRLERAMADKPDLADPLPVRAPRGRVDPFTPEAAGGLIGAIARWSLEYGRSPVPEFAVLSAVSFVAAMYGRRAVGPTGAGLNLYLVGVAGPGFGKEHAHKTLHTLAMDTGLQYLIGPGEVTSGSAIEKVVRKRPVFVMPWDEIGVVLQSVTGSGSSSWAKTIRKVLLEIFSKSDSVWSGKEHADPTVDNSASPIYCPTVSILGMSTPTTFYRGLTEETLMDGFIARLIVVEAKERPERRRVAPLLVTPKSLIEEVKNALAALPFESGGNIPQSAFRDAALKPKLFTVPWADEEAADRWSAIEDWQIEQIEEHGAHDGLIGRTAEHVIKLATVRAISMCPSNPSVSLDDIEWAYAFVQRSIDNIDAGAREHMAGSQFEELCKAILRVLHKSKTKDVAQSQLVRAKGVSKADDRMVKAALDRLVVSGEIYAPAVSGKGVRIRLKEAAVEAE